MGEQTSIGLGGGEAIIVDRPIRAVTQGVTQAKRDGAFFAAIDVRADREMWVNPMAVKVLQEVCESPDA
jgi:hypothetical protein